MVGRYNNGPTKVIVARMIAEWQITNTDFLGFIQEDKDFFSYHHLRTAACNNGPTSIYNGAILLGYSAHPYLHTIADKDREKFNDLTKILIEVNDQFYLPTKKQLIRANEIFAAFEREYCGQTSKRGYPLIRECYTRRLIK